MSKTVEHMKECEVHIQDLEKENLDLHQKMNVDNKTLTTLRQVCVSSSSKCIASLAADEYRCWTCKLPLLCRNLDNNIIVHCSFLLM